MSTCFCLLLPAVAYAAALQPSSISCISTSLHMLCARLGACCAVLCCGVAAQADAARCHQLMYQHFLTCVPLNVCRDVLRRAVLWLLRLMPPGATSSGEDDADGSQGDSEAAESERGGSEDAEEEGEEEEEDADEQEGEEYEDEGGYGYGNHFVGEWRALPLLIAPAGSASVLSAVCRQTGVCVMTCFSSASRHNLPQHSNLIIHLHSPPSLLPHSRPLLS